jgi:hypothetical protein
MRREAEFFDDGELDLLYMARTLRDSLKLERILEDAGIEYLVETGTYTAGFLIKRDLTGAFFYVTPGDAQRAREILTRSKYKPYQCEGTRQERDG